MNLIESICRIIETMYSKIRITTSIKYENLIYLHYENKYHENKV